MRCDQQSTDSSHDAHHKNDPRHRYRHERGMWRNFTDFTRGYFCQQRPYCTGFTPGMRTLTPSGPYGLAIQEASSLPVTRHKMATAML